MARKSRRVEAAQELANEPVKEPDIDMTMATAAYVRLSVEDPDGENEGSIQNQLDMLRQYIAERPELRLVDNYIDNGYSGTNFSRPEFVRLMDDVRTGRIHCIVVKDLSRFGRDYLETGYYIETILPHLNVRLIAITDEFDSFREEDRNSLAIPIKNIVNAMYAKDISRKICAANRERRKRTDVVPVGSPLFGYLVSEDKTKYVPHPVIAPYVRMAFHWRLMGLRPVDIAKRFTLLGVVTPGQYKKAGGKIADVKPEPWKSEMVQGLFVNPNYTGDLALGRIQQALYKAQPSHWTSPDEWTVIQNAHEPLVTKVDYQKLRYMLENCSMRKGRKEAFNLEQREKLQDHFPNMVYCKECGRYKHFNRYLHNYYTKEKVTSYYDCPPKFGKARCGGYRIYEDFLKVVVMDQIHLLIKGMCDRKKLLDRISTDGKNKNIFRSVERKIMALDSKIAEMENKTTLLYENYAEGMLEAEEYSILKEKYLQDAQKLQKKMQELMKKKKEMENTIARYLDLTKNLEEYLDQREFDEKLVLRLVERITVSSTGSIEILFSCNDVYQQMEDIIEGCEEV